MEEYFDHTTIDTYFDTHYTSSTVNHFDVTSGDETDPSGADHRRVQFFSIQARDTTTFSNSVSGFNKSFTTPGNTYDEYLENVKIRAYRGNNLVNNPSFDSSSTSGDWGASLPANWTIANGKATISTASASNLPLYQNITVTDNDTLTFAYSVQVLTGSLSIQLEDKTITATSTTYGRVMVIADGTSATVKFDPSSTFTGSVYYAYVYPSSGYYTKAADGDDYALIEYTGEITYTGSNTHETLSDGRIAKKPYFTLTSADGWNPDYKLRGLKEIIFLDGILSRLPFNMNYFCFVYRDLVYYNEYATTGDFTANTNPTAGTATLTDFMNALAQGTDGTVNAKYNLLELMIAMQKSANSANSSGIGFKTSDNKYRKVTAAPSFMGYFDKRDGIDVFEQRNVIETLKGAFPYYADIIEDNYARLQSEYTIPTYTAPTY